MTENSLSDLMGIRDQRRHTRLEKNFQVLLHKKVHDNLDLSPKGRTLDLSQSGAFIETGGWHLFEPGEITKLIFFLPPDFTGMDTPVGLRGDAVITRIDREKEGIAVVFIKTFKEFERIDLPDLH